MNKEASARIKINELLLESGWRFFDEKGNKANIILENQTKLTQKLIDEFGNDFEKASRGFIDFLLIAGQRLPLPGEDIWAENKSLKVPTSVISNSEDIRIEIVAGSGDEAKLLYASRTSQI